MKAERVRSAISLSNLPASVYESGAHALRYITLKPAVIRL